MVYSFILKTPHLILIFEEFSGWIQNSWFAEFLLSFLKMLPHFPLDFIVSYELSYA